MEINANGTGLGVLEYLETADDRYRQRVIKYEADFLRFRAQAEALAEIPQEQELLRRVGLLYQEYRALGGALMDQADRRKYLLAAIAHDVEVMDYILDEEIRLRVDPQGTDALAKITAALHLEANAYELAVRLGHYLEDPQPQYVERLVDDAGEFQVELARFKHLALTEQEMVRIAQVEDRFNTVWAGIQEAVALREGMARELDRFLGLRASLDDLLDEEVQVLSHQNLAEAGTAVEQTVRNTHITVFALLIAGLVAGAFTVFAIIRSVTRPVGRLVAASQRVAAGDLSQRVNMDSRDEFRILGDAFDQMVATRQEAETALQQAHGQLEQRVQGRTAQLAQANRTITGINEVTRAITSTLDVGQVYDLFAQGMKKLVDYDRMAINLVDREAGAFVFKYASGVIQPGRQVGDRVPLAGTQTQYVVETGRPLIRQDIAADLRFHVDETYLQVGLRSHIMVPLIVKGQVVATFNLCSCEVGTYGPQEQEILEQIAAQVASAFENARLYEDVQKRTEELAQANQSITGMNELSRSIASTLDIVQVYQRFAQQVKELVDYDRVVINLIDQDAGTLQFKYAAGLVQGVRQVDDVVPLAGTQSGEVVATGKPLVRPDIAADVRFNADPSLVRLGIRSIIVLPLIAKGRVVGSYSLCSRRAGVYGPPEQEILQQAATHLSSTVENARLYEEVQKRTGELLQANQVITGINEVTQIITSTLDINQVYQQFAQKAKSLVDFDRISINVVSRDAGTFTFKYVTGLSFPGRNPGDSMPLAGSQVEKATLTGCSQVRDNITAGSGDSSAPEMARMGVRSSILVPLVAKGEVIGGLGLWSCRSGAYGAKEQEILERLAAQIAPTVENARLYEEVQKRTEELAQANQTITGINKVSRIITSTLDIDQVYEPFAQEVKKLVDYDRIAINVIDRHAGVFIFKYAHGQLQPGRRVGHRVPLPGTQTEHVMTTGKTLVRPDIATDPQFSQDETFLKLGIRSAIVVPLMVKGQVIGALSLRGRQVGAYGPREQEILEQIAAQVASAFENARLYEEVQKRTEELAQANEELEAGVAELRQAEAVEHQRNVKLAAQFTIAQILSRPGDSQEKPGLVLMELRGIAQVDSITLRVRDDQEQGLRLVAESSRTEREIPPTPLLPFQGSVPGVASETGQPMVINDYPSHPYATPNGIARGTKSVLGMPVKTSSMTLGVATFISRELNHFTPERVELLTAVMSEVGVLLENDRLYQDAVQEKERTATALAQLQAVLEGVDAGILLVGEDHKTVLWANQRFGELFGVDDLESVVGDAGLHARLRRLTRRALEDPKEFFAEVDRIYQDRSYVGVTEDIQLAGPQPRLVRRFTTPVHRENGDYLGRLWVYTDVTEQQRLEAQFRQSQKMEVVGRLAGGVAHDFNNLLTAILGYTQLASAQLPAEHPVSGHLQEVEKATQRAANLTRQLMTFSRHQAVEPAMADINQIIMEIHGMVRRLIGEDVELVTLPVPDLPPVKVDRGQVEQLVMNLVVNARDAMPSGGKITIATAGVLLGAQQAAQVEGVSPGRYVVLSIADTGTGMSDEVKAHLFEPFFTTKEVGKGTGLGLATCYGIVRRAGGHIEVESEPGQGATFQIYLPAQSPQDADGPGKEQPQGLPWGTETVLLAEDEAALRTMVAQTLEELGYTVLQAADGEEGLRVARERQAGVIHLLLTDIVMPRMGGVELASRFKTEWPDARVLFVSGYSEDPLLQHSANRRDMDFMQKPFLPAALARRVREILDR
jgi:GAF domain-containing protein/nitrogen-specific signal transduction histidine kinase